MAKRFQDHSRKGRSLFGHRVCQTWSSIWVLDKLLSKYKPTRIAELGTGNGVLSTYFMTYCRLAEAEFLTIDLRKSTLLSEEIRFLQVNIVADETIKTVTEFLNSTEKPFLLVDGNNPKSSDLNLYAPHLKAGTVIFAHDYHFPSSEKPKPMWCFTEDMVDWSLVRRLEPYYSWGEEMDTRMLAKR